MKLKRFRPSLRASRGADNLRNVIDHHTIISKILLRSQSRAKLARMPTRKLTHHHAQARAYAQIYSHDDTDEQARALMITRECTRLPMHTLSCLDSCACSRACAHAHTCGRAHVLSHARIHTQAYPHTLINILMRTLMRSY
jgi:hypothetical protein